MAQFHLFSVLVHTPPGSSDFIVNDVIDMYWDDSTSAIVVKKNNVDFFGSAGGFFGELDTNYYLSRATSFQGQYAIASYSFCSGADLKWFRMLLDYAFYPYAELRTTVDSPVCDTTPGGGVVCDIQFQGPVIATNTTSLTDPDGTITASATSSNGTVKYGLTDFVYATEGQASGNFTGLGTGKYTVYAKDANDCTVQTSVFVFYSPAEQEHYRFTWWSLATGQGTSYQERVRIYEREYVGSVVEIDYGTINPFHLRKPKQGEINDKFFPVHPTSALLNLTSIEDYQYLPLFTQDNKKYRVVYEINDGGFAEAWQGFILPSVFRQQFLMGIPGPIELQITDNVKTLEEEDFTDDNGNLLTGKMKLIKIISHIMKKTGLRLKIRSSINIFEVNHVQESDGSSDPLDQTYVDVACYRKGTDPFKCWDVLRFLLRPFGARILQEENQWIIEEIDRATEAYAYRVFDANGDYESNSTFDPILDIKNQSDVNRAVMINRDHSLEVVPAYGKIDITSKLNYVGSIVAGGFEKEDLLSPDSEEFKIGQGIFISEEGFKDWTLRMPAGISGVSFGRILVSNRGDSSRTGLKTDANEATRSIGAFFYNPDTWSGNLRDAYIESAAKPYQYGPGDQLKFYFEYSTPARPEYEFMVLRVALKVGNNYLQPDRTWDTAEAIYRSYPAISNSLQKFELHVPVPETDVIVDTTVQVRIYFYAAGFYDHGLPTRTNDAADGTDGVASLDTVVTAGVDYDYRLDLRNEIIIGGTFVAFRRVFLELRASEAATDMPNGIRRVGDYNTTTNPKVWYALKIVNMENDEVNANRRGVDLKFYIDNVALDALVNGQPPPEEETISLQISDFINESLPIELYNFDVPDITNAKNMYNNHFQLSDGTPTSAWSRSGETESLKIQQILLKVLGANHSAPTFRLTGSFMNEFQRIKMNNYLRITKPGASIAMLNTGFATDLSNWAGDVSGQQFVWTADNGGSAEVTLSGSEDSEKFYQEVEHDGGHIQVAVDIHVEPTATNDREDQLWLLFYRNGVIIYTEKMITISAPTSPDDHSFLYTAFVPGDVDRIGFYFRRVSGTGECTYQVGEFNPAGTDIPEVYQIADYQYDEKMSKGIFELMQMSKAYISLAGVDIGGNNQSGSGEGQDFSGDFNEDFGGDFDTILN